MTARLDMLQAADAREEALLEAIQFVETPAFILDVERLRANLRRIAAIRDRSFCKIVLAMKAFAMFSVFPVMRDVLDGAAVGSLNEARLASEELGGAVHAYSPAFAPEEFREICGIADYVTFNSFAQYERFIPVIRRSARPIACGIRINPEHREVVADIYDPCAPYSRLGVTATEFGRHSWTGTSGLHVHGLCAHGADAAERLVHAVETKFGAALDDIEWLNLGGGHLVGCGDYDAETLCRVISGLQAGRGLQVILEPGEGIVHGAGYLVASVLDMSFNGKWNLILDVSAANHVPTLAENFRRLDIIGASDPDVHQHVYRLGGCTCLAGDTFGDYSFAEPLQVGDRVVIRDMAHYTMVRDTMFNGVNLPSRNLFNRNGDIQCVRRFGYDDYRGRLS